MSMDQKKNGAALTFLEALLEETAQQEYLLPVTADIFYSEASRHLDPRLTNFNSLSHMWSFQLRHSDEVIFYQKKEVGALIRFREVDSQRKEGLIIKDYLLRLPSVMNLNPAQLLEAECLLKKVGETLGFSLPEVGVATEEAKRSLLIQLALEAVRSKPQSSHRKFLDRLKAAGTPVDMSAKEFADFVTSTLTSL